MVRDADILWFTIGKLLVTDSGNRFSCRSQYGASGTEHER
jgi:hypothetical protein